MIKKLITTFFVCLIISFSSVSNAVSPGEGGGAGGTSIEGNHSVLIYVDQPPINHIGPMFLFNLNRFLLISTKQLSQVDIIALPDGSLIESDVIEELIEESLADNPNSILIILPLDRKYLK